MPVLPLLLVSTLGASASHSRLAVVIGQEKTERASPVVLRSFGRPEQKGGRSCRNSDETGLGDGKAGYAAVNVPTAAGKSFSEIRLAVWGESDPFSVVAHNGTEYRTVGKGHPSGRPRWEEIRFILKPSQLDPDSDVQRFGFGARDSQVWVSRFEFRNSAGAPPDPKALAAARAHAAADAVVLTAAGSSDAAISVKPRDDPVLRYGAEELQKYILEISGALLPLGVPGEGPRVHITVDASLFGEPDGFELRTSEAGIDIRGGSSLGALFGVYALLETFGCRWIRPGPDGEVVPRRDSLVVPRLEVHQEPDFPIRWIGQGDWALKNRCNVNATVAQQRVGIAWKWSFHSFYGLLPPERYWDEHPEYYPLVNGKRRRPDGYSNTQICTTNPDVIREVADNIIAIFREDPGLDVVALCPNDGGGFCTCPSCMALDRPDPDFWGRYSDRLAVFNNAVARRVGKVFPDKLLKTGAYAMYMRYPADPAYRPEPNMAVQACHTYACNNHAIEAPDCRRNKLYFREPLEKWAAHSKHLWIYEYYIKGAWAGLLYTQTHIMQRDIQYYRRLGAESFYTQWSRGAFGSVGLDFYVATRLVWDADADVDAVIRDYCTSFYGVAGEPMIRFHQRLARAFVESEDCISPFGYKRVWLAAPRVFTPEVVQDLGRHLADAIRRAPDDRVRRRLEPVETTFGYTKQAMAYLRTVVACFDDVATPSSAGYAAAAAKARELGDAAAADVIAYLDEHGLGKAARNPRSKIAQLLRVHRNPKTAVGRWYGLEGASATAAVKTLPPIPGSRFVGQVSDRARVHLDREDLGLRTGWADTDFDDSAWEETAFPAYWQDAGIADLGYQGLGWYRTAFVLPPGALPKGMRLLLRFNGVDAAATVFVNGRVVAKHAFVPGQSWRIPFDVDITEAARQGKNSLVLRVYTGGGKGGVYAPVQLYRLGDEPEDFMR